MMLHAVTNLVSMLTVEVTIQAPHGAHSQQPSGAGLTRQDMLGHQRRRALAAQPAVDGLLQVAKVLSPLQCTGLHGFVAQLESETR